jgi:DivIVA domain-containing protein
MPEFSMVLRGYDRRQVDDVVARLEGTLGRAPLKGGPITFKQLKWTEFDIVMRGYNRHEVDEVMRRYRRELAALEGVELPDDGPGSGPMPSGPREETHHGDGFSVVLRGYDRRQVDDVVAQLEGTLGRAPLKGGPITIKHLGWTTFDVVMRGYDRFEVDGAMRRYRRELAVLEGVELPDDEPDGGLDFVLGGGSSGRPGSPPLPPELREEIRREHGFSVALRGYDRRQVDRFIVRLWGHLGRYSLHAYGLEPDPVEEWELNDPGFDVVMRGYDKVAVDQAMADYRRRLARY